MSPPTRSKLAKSMSGHGVRAVLPAVIDAMDPKEKWQTMVGALDTVSTLALTSPLANL